jgi:beta-galactosidase
MISRSSLVSARIPDSLNAFAATAFGISMFSRRSHVANFAVARKTSYISPMRERFLMDKHWRFALGHAADHSRDFEFARSRCLVKAGEARGAAGHTFDDSKWEPVDLPHDWALDLPLDPNGDKELAEHGFRSIGPDHPEHSVGWYRRTFEIPAKDLGRRISVEFGGAFRESIVWVNGHRLGRHQSGYTGFQYDLTDFLNYGGTNVLAVRLDATSWEGWWYEGAGIYRHVWLIKTPAVHIVPNGTFVTTRIGKANATSTVLTRVINQGDGVAAFQLNSTIYDGGGKVVGRATRRQIKLAAGEEVEVKEQIKIRSPKLWSCEEPNLYKLHSEIKCGGEVDEFGTTFGIRSLRWDARRGFFLNGKRVEIKGTCNHQQHGGLGIALPDRIQSLRIEKLKELGSNAYRCSHYAATRELLDACDRLGMLVMAENRLAGSSPEVLGQFESMIRRDRNHPSIILWSIANEEHSIQWKIAGERIGKTMVNLAHRLDPTRKVTSAMHDRGLGEGFANIVDVHGWNYMNVGSIEAFHGRRPEQPMVGSEEGSTVCTRGIYKDDPERGYVSAYDVRAPNWGSTAEKCWTFFAQRPWLAGLFIWTGFDYYGEPIPYQWPCTGSHFGLMDLCGFPKDIYYYYKSWWSDQTVLHLMPHWNWDAGQSEPIDVWCFSNCDEVELFLNDKSLGRKAMPRNSHLAWSVNYEPGRLVARGFRAGRRVAEVVNETSGIASRIVLTTDRKRIWADGEDVASVQISIVDDQGRVVPTADHAITIEVSSAGKLLGMCNGDPSSHESKKANSHRTFNGLALAIVQSTDRSGEIRIQATSAQLAAATVLVRGSRRKLRPRI